jgi:hypothetical protein
VKVYLTRDFLQTGKITEADGHPCTGHSDTIQVNGIRPQYGRARIYGPGQWFTDYGAALDNCRNQLDTYRMRLTQQADRLAQSQAWLDKIEHEFNAAYTIEVRQ